MAWVGFPPNPPKPGRLSFAEDSWLEAGTT